jgi:hypothetical protein
MERVELSSESRSSGNQGRAGRYAGELAANPEGYNDIFYSQSSCSFERLHCAVEFSFNGPLHCHLQEHGASDTLTSPQGNPGEAFVMYLL